MEPKEQNCGPVKLGRLLLGRKKGEAIIVGDNLYEFKLLEVRYRWVAMLYTNRTTTPEEILLLELEKHRPYCASKFVCVEYYAKYGVQARFIVSADTKLPVYRDEIYRKILEEKANSGK